MSKQLLILVMAGLIAPAIFANAQQILKVTKVPAKPTSAVSGESMYVNYCAACHGTNGKGNGPALRALNSRPEDLTMLARNNGGKFPVDHVVSVLRFGSTSQAHDSINMPVWGPILGSLNRSNSVAEQQQRISNLTRYLNTMQVN
jgi:hypothetical protein